jgi:hypothetical protein
MQFGPIHPAKVGNADPPRFSVGWQMCLGTAVAFVVCVIPRRRVIPTSDPNPVPSIRNPQSEIRNAS